MEITFRSQDNLINTNENCLNKFPSKSDPTPIENESIPKMQLNMFIQKDGKQSGSKKWPKVETPFCRQNKIAEAASSSTKKLILKYNTGVVRPDLDSERRNSLADRRSNTKNLIKKWNNPQKLTSGPVTGGFQGIQSIMQEISGQQHPQPQPRHSLPRQQDTVLRRSFGGGSHDTILKRNNGAHGWQAADI